MRWRERRKGAPWDIWRQGHASIQAETDLGRSVGSGVMPVSAEKERLGGDEHTAKASSGA